MTRKSHLELMCCCSMNRHERMGCWNFQAFDKNTYVFSLGSPPMPIKSDNDFMALHWLHDRLGSANTVTTVPFILDLAPGDLFSIMQIDMGAYLRGGAYCNRLLARILMAHKETSTHEFHAGKVIQVRLPTDKNNKGFLHFCAVFSQIRALYPDVLEFFLRSLIHNM